MLHDELFKAIRGGYLADYISANYHKLSGEDLKAIIVELVITMYDNGISEGKIDLYDLMDRLDYEYYNSSY